MAMAGLAYLVTQGRSIHTHNRRPKAAIITAHTCDRNTQQANLALHPLGDANVKYERNPREICSVYGTVIQRCRPPHQIPSANSIT